MQWQAASVAMVISPNDTCIFISLHCFSVCPLGTREGATVSPQGGLCTIGLHLWIAFSCVSELFTGFNLSILHLFS